MNRRLVSVVVLLVATLFPESAQAQTTESDYPVNDSAPTIDGAATYRSPLRADPGGWTPAEGVTFGYQWRRADVAIPDATGRRYRPGLEDLGQRLSVLVTATDTEGQSTTAESARTARVRRAPMRIVARPAVAGTRRYGQVLTVERARFDPRRVRRSVRWLRDGEPIRGERSRRYRLTPQDVGHRIRVRVTARKEGFRPRRASSRPTRRIMHRVPRTRTATYRIETRGDIGADLGVFRRQVAQTFADPRGWRSAGVAFRRVEEGGDFSVVLAEAGHVPGFSSGCSAQWSCRVGRYVIINQRRWLHASESWNAAGQSLRGYRHMVVNHETGHWLGHGHLGCSGAGRAAPVMMQQSKSLGGCRHNPWPLPSELWLG